VVDPSAPRAPGAHTYPPLYARLRHAFALLAALSLLAGCGGSESVPAPGPMVGTRLDASLPPPVVGASLVSSSGRRMKISDLVGKVVVISDVMTLCQETCPLDTANVVQAARDVETAGLGNKVEFLSITVDPTRDTAARLAAYRKLYAPAPANWLTLTGTPATLATLWKTLGVYTEEVPDTPPAPKDWLTGQPLTYDITHSDEVFFIGAGGAEKFILEGAPHVAAGAPIPATLRKFMDAQGRSNISNPDPQAWTLPQELRVLSWLTDHRIPHTAPAG
jgi:protein SCO1/2